jgi:hypothetical protein
MRTLRLLVVAALAVGAFAALAPGADAAAPAKTKIQKFCAAVQGISSGSKSGSDAAAARKLVNTTKKAAKLAPTSKVKSALNDMAGYFDALGNSDNPSDAAAAAAKFATKYAKATTTFTTYYIKNCATVST